MEGEVQTEDILRSIENWIATSTDHNPNELEGKVTDQFLPLINSISGAFTQYHENSKSYEDQIQQLETEKKELQDQNQELQEQSENNRKSIQDLQEQLDSVKKMVQARRVAFSSENFNLQQNQQNNEGNNQQEQQQQQQQQSPTKSQKLTPSNKPSYTDQESEHLKKLEQANRQLSLKLNSLKEQNDALKKTHQQYASEKETQLQQIQMDAAEREADLKAKLQALETENVTIKKDNDNREVKITKKDQRIDTLKSIIEKKDSELGALHLQISELQDQVVNQEQLVEENKQIQAKLQEYEQNKQRERELYKRNIEMVQAECNDKVATYQRRITELDRALTKSQLDNQELNSTIKEATENANSVIHESQILSTKVQELQEQNSTLLQEKTQLEEKVSLLSQNSTEISMNETRHEEQAQPQQQEQNAEEEQKPETPEPAAEAQQQQQTQEQENAHVSNAEETPVKEEKTEEEEKAEKSTEQPNSDNAVKDPRVDALEETVLELAKKVDNLSAMMSPVSQKNQQQKSGSLVDSTEEQQAPNGQSVSAKFVVEQFSDLVNGNKDETSSNATDILKKTKRRVTHLQKKYSDAREVIKTVQSLVQETNPIICHASLSRIFGLE